MAYRRPIIAQYPRSRLASGAGELRVTRRFLTDGNHAPSLRRRSEPCASALRRRRRKLEPCAWALRRRSRPETCASTVRRRRRWSALCVLRKIPNPSTDGVVATGSYNNGGRWRAVVDRACASVDWKSGRHRSHALKYCHFRSGRDGRIGNPNSSK